MRIFNPFVSPAGLRARVAQQLASVGSTGIGAENLFTYNVLPNQFGATGNGVILTAHGLSLNNANAKTVGVAAAGQLQNFNISINIGAQWFIQFYLWKSGLNQQRGFLAGYSLDGATHLYDRGVVAEQASAANDGVGYTVALQVNTLAANDIFLRNVMIETV